MPGGDTRYRLRSPPRSAPPGARLRRPRTARSPRSRARPSTLGARDTPVPPRSGARDTPVSSRSGPGARDTPVPLRVPRSRCLGHPDPVPHPSYPRVQCAPALKTPRCPSPSLLPRRAERPGAGVQLVPVSKTPRCQRASLPPGDAPAPLPDLYSAMQNRPVPVVKIPVPECGAGAHPARWGA